MTSADLLHSPQVCHWFLSKSAGVGLNSNNWRGEFCLHCPIMGALDQLAASINPFFRRYNTAKTFGVLVAATMIGGTVAITLSNYVCVTTKNVDKKFETNFGALFEQKFFADVAHYTKFVYNAVYPGWQCHYDALDPGKGHNLACPWFDPMGTKNPGKFGAQPYRYCGHGWGPILGRDATTWESYDKAPTGLQGPYFHGCATEPHRQ